MKKESNVMKKAAAKKKAAGVRKDGLTKQQEKVLLAGGKERLYREIADAFDNIVDSAYYLGQIVLLGRSEFGTKEFDSGFREMGVLLVTIESCVQVAKGNLDPRLVLLTGNNGVYTAVAKHDLKTQKELLDKGVLVREYTEDGKETHRLVRLENLSDAQKEYCIDGKRGFRTLEEQDRYFAVRRKVFEFAPDTNKERQPFETSADFAERQTRLAQLEKQRADEAAKAAIEAIAPEPEPADTPAWEIRDGQLYFLDDSIGYDALAMMDLSRKLMEVAQKAS